jgi:predicted glycoside hydrolase/deacetylase ChbG (UPF0249 family)
VVYRHENDFGAKDDYGLGRGHAMAIVKVIKEG